MRSDAASGGGSRALPRLHAVTDAALLLDADWPERARAALAAGGSALALHVRGPGLSGRALFESVAALLEPAARAGALLIVNERVDVAMSLGVGGVQLPEGGLPVAQARRILGADRRLGASVHGAARARTATADGADYLLVGTLFATGSHPDRPGGGRALLAEVLAVSELPLVAIGGVSPERVEEARAWGAYGVAALGGVWRSGDPARAVRAYLEALDDGSEA